MTRIAAATALAAVLAAAPAAAHHGWSSFDSGKLVTVAGQVVESSYDNPHGEIVVDADGQRWHVVLAPPSRMNHRGLSRQDVAVGSTVTVEGRPSLEKEQAMRAERITVGERTIELR